MIPEFLKVHHQIEKSHAATVVLVTSYWITLVNRCFMFVDHNLPRLAYCTLGVRSSIW